MASRDRDRETKGLSAADVAEYDAAKRAARKKECERQKAMTSREGDGVHGRSSCSPRTLIPGCTSWWDSATRLRTTGSPPPRTNLVQNHPSGLTARGPDR